MVCEVVVERLFLKLIQTNRKQIQEAKRKVHKFAAENFANIKAIKQLSYETQQVDTHTYTYIRRHTETDRPWYVYVIYIYIYI